ncbi:MULTISPECIES: 16S rRNA (guanine(966)-N(2))-methyltransferase RsmD [Shouchella]|uniref:16S rRNA (Guanine(966)-N(2))-methyltransferase RsmD n=2 Tax=Shouchella TaxID=2893057 RepID=A0ABY7W4J4_9BACI|nr:MULTISPECIES: 16S rRNA (guanine(966)-N(2))-methyltransferase RsmD [Shouchella]MED4127405.1 16S rRNA (guanine(966)-N(2))-methyltransferase RsmD [Shouchella miscanthi]WDF03875.1 16S rRNA (guanine(966)-N(2))-methyltransferase RsmD [Shouchella hunanensis]
MRVISGQQGGLRLKPVPGKQTRPTTDKVKESIFNMIGPYFDGGQVLDLFAGSGALGIEALSRGMDRCIFIEAQHPAIQTIRQNLSHTKLSERASVFKNDSLRGLQVLIGKGETFQLLLIDPPYAKAELYIKEALAKIDESSVLEEGGLIVCETASSSELASFSSLQIIRTEQYGETKITIYERVSGHETSC